MTNPLLTPFSPAAFSAIKPEHVVPAVTKALEDCRAAVESARRTARRIAGKIFASRWRKG